MAPAIQGMRACRACADPTGKTADAESASLLESPVRRDFITGEGAEPVGSSPQKFSAYFRSEVERYSGVVKAGRLRVD